MHAEHSSASKHLAHCAWTAALCCLWVAALGGCDSDERPGRADDTTNRVLSELPLPTRLAWSPDGRLFVGDLRGRLTAFRYDDAWNEVERVEVASLEGTESDVILGLAFDPLDGSLFVAHSRLRVYSCADDAWPFRGRISALRPPDYDTWEAVVTGLPNGKTTHGVNDLLFLPDGDLLVSIGGVTNAGVPSCEMGSIPESPLSGAVLRLPVHDVDFDGALRFELTADGSPTDDQRDGNRLRVAGSQWGSVEATGFRNALGMELCPSGKIYVLDNGPNQGDGDALSGEDELPIAEHPDELNLLQRGSYYGHPNAARGERIYHNSLEPQTGGFVQALRTLPASSNGIVYLESAIEGLERALILQQFDGDTFVVALDADDLPIGDVQLLHEGFPCLDIVRGPGDTLVGSDFVGGRILLLRLNELTGAGKPAQRESSGTRE